MNLEDTVEQIVNDFVVAGTLFTALDVSNKVKKTMPFARHREVRDIVREMYQSMQTLSYGKTPIKVELADGSKVEALLYHPLSSSWDLDTAYDDQKRSQSSFHLPKSSMAAGSAAVVASISPTPPVQVSVPTTNPKQMWDNLFDNSRLFPKV